MIASLSVRLACFFLAVAGIMIATHAQAKELIVLTLASYATEHPPEELRKPVAGGEYDAGAATGRAYEKYAREKGFRELFRFQGPTQAWIAKSKTAPDVAKALRATLLEMNWAELDYIDRNGFLPASDSGYDELREIMTISKGFGG